eukprot:NODE_1858_length_712_cov_67.622222_g1808_i0.p1 GENE.NODE_1858_length_712_cov_67.622222_g1808_i0~~NODE_1858_length_712_cov_67.622222_g1808_i0.p1  ORF type:complete len:180 (-),score=45.54 NODE_1858_length_712_cov_67.622222_g1808_i0:104-643(-)
MTIWVNYEFTGTTALRLWGSVNGYAWEWNYYKVTNPPAAAQIDITIGGTIDCSDSDALVQLQEDICELIGSPATSCQIMSCSENAKRDGADTQVMVIEDQTSNDDMNANVDTILAADSVGGRAMAAALIGAPPGYNQVNPTDDPGSDPTQAPSGTVAATPFAMLVACVGVVAATLLARV